MRTSKRTAAKPAEEKTKAPLWPMFSRLFLHVRGQWPLLLAAWAATGCIAALQFVIPRLTEYAIDHVIPNRDYNMLLPIAGGVMLTAVLLGVFGYASSYAFAKVGQRTVLDIRTSLYRHLQSLDMAYFDRKRTGELMSRVTSDVNQLQQMVSAGTMGILTDAVTFIAIACFMLYQNVQLTAVLLALFPLMLLAARLYGGKLRSSYRNVQETVADMSGQLQDSLSQIRLVKTFAAEERENTRFAELGEANKEANLAATRFSALFGPAIDLLQYVGMAFVLAFGSWQAMRGNGEMTAGSMVAYLAYLRLLQNPVRRFSRLMSTMQQSAAAYDRIIETMNTSPQVADRDGAKELHVGNGEVVFKEVTFGYGDPADSAPLLSRFNLVLQPGQTTALVGSSGAGKSTLAHLLLRYYDVWDGAITVDGMDLREVTQASLRRRIGIVTQETMLRSGSVRENLLYGRPEASEDELLQAAKAACAHEFIEALPAGYDTEIGERGVRLSGGQKQRLSIARALLANPAIILLDEATASLDTESEALIQQALQTLLHGRTCLVIAHRLSTVRSADRIVVLEKGRLIESGNHDELLQLDGRYRSLYERQFPQGKETENPHEA
ncbi:ATP-binding cassette, subfamily B, MsbA [Paenibacillaceae bacterium GAS479]|nr:ATP-binding cassette, subfamily B, MsbA [Paenibacillaceae bacterium GAS479]